MPVDQRIKKCHQVQKINLNACHTLVYAIDSLDKENAKMWRASDDFILDSKNYNKLNKAYEMVRDARDHLRDIMGDVD